MEAEITLGTQQDNKGSKILFDDVIGYLQYESSKIVTEGMVLPYVLSCPKNFKQIEANGIKIVDGEPLAVTPITNQSNSNNIYSKVIFCHTTLYSITITIIEDDDKAHSKCPPDWTNIGYKAINPYSTPKNKFNYLVCAK